MKKFVLTALTALSTLTLAAGPAFAATAQPVQLVDGSGVTSSVLNTGNQGAALVVPLADLGGALPSDLSLATSGLPAGVTITLRGVSVSGGNALLWVTAQRSNPATLLDATADIALVSGGATLATVSVPVFGAANHL